MTQKICPECGSEKIAASSSSEMVCAGCGFVLDDSPLDSSPMFSEEAKSSPQHPYLLYAGTGIGGRIVKGNWLLTTREKNLRSARRSLESIASRLRLPNYAVNEATILFKRAVEQDINIGRDNRSMLLASVYAASLMHNVPKTAFEITLYTGITQAKMLRSYRLLKQKLKLQIESVRPTDLIQRFGSRLKLQQSTLTIAYEILQKIDGTSVVLGKHPQTIAAAALYLAGNQNKEPRTQRQVANVTGVIEVTIRKRSREISLFNNS